MMVLNMPLAPIEADVQPALEGCMLDLHASRVEQGEHHPSPSERPGTPGGSSL